MTVELKTVAMAAGLLLGALSLTLLVAPRRACAVLTRFPRNRVAGWILSAAALAWSAWLLYHTPLGRFEWVKTYLWILGAVSYVLIVTFMDELLAPRALGALMILAPAPMLTVARWHASPWRLVMVALAYVIAVAGTVLVLSPYRFRLTAAAAMRGERRGRWLGAAGTALALALLLIALTAY
jgi:hypothetical protein